MKKNVGVIGSGFAGLSAACFLAKDGLDVTIYEKNPTIGGRARSFTDHGFTFDMGPSWYWMPDVFERFFNQFGKSTSNYYDLVRLDPSYRVIFSENESIDIPAKETDLIDLFEEIETGSGKKLQKFLKDAQYKYAEGIQKLVYMPSLSITEFLRLDLLKGFFKIQLFNSISSEINQKFKDPRLRSILEFPSLFLGATPENTPALYSLMNYADLKLGTWYPMGGMVKIIEGMESLAEELGVNFKTNTPIQQIKTQNGRACDLVTSSGSHQHDYVVSAADYHHTEQHLLSTNDRSYHSKYWDKRVMAPSAVIYYLGVSKKIKNLLHHNLFFDEDFKKHAFELYESPQWPEKPLFYVCAPSKTDSSVAPEGKENLFILIPVAPGLTNDSEEMREKYLNLVLDRIEKYTKDTVKDHIEYKRSYSISDFVSDYNSFKGNAYGLANTLKQTAILKPKIRSKKIKNLYYTGQLTVPGPGVPPALISGEVVAQQITSKLNQNERTL